MKERRGILLLLVLAFAGCDNMHDQPHRGDGVTETRTPRFDEIHRAPHSIARGEPSPRDPFTSGFTNGELLASSPVPFTREVLLRGQDRFNIYCAACHGADGYGRGIVVRRGFPPPPSYHDDRLRQAPDGHFFDVMTRGYGVMLPFADRLSLYDRWAVVGYIRALQRSQHAALADVPPEARNTLGP